MFSASLDAALKRPPEPIDADAPSESERRARVRQVKAGIGLLTDLRARPFFDSDSFALARKLTFRKNPTYERIKFYLLTQLAYMPFHSVVNASRLVDDWLFPDYRKEKLEAPLFIFANARSGTTFLHRLMSLDEERFTHLNLYDTILQSVTLVKAADQLPKLDEALGGRLTRLLEWADDYLFGFWKDIHPMGIAQPEEDEGYFVFNCITPGVFAFYPFVTELAHCAWLDKYPDDVRRKVMRDYEGAIKRHLYTKGRGRQFLNKTVMLSGRIDTTLELFPDARFIYLVRHPYEAIPSFLSMFYAAWQISSKDIPKQSEGMHTLARIAIDYYKKGLDVRRYMLPEQYLIVRYTDLIADPQSVVHRIYSHFNMQMSPEYAGRLVEEAQQAKSFKSNHSYSLEEFGISKELVYESLKEVFDEFDFER